MKLRKKLAKGINVSAKQGFWGLIEREGFGHKPFSEAIKFFICTESSLRMNKIFLSL